LKPTKTNILLELIETNKDEYIAREGYREYSCLVALVEYGDIKTPSQLAEYGIDITPAQ
jgi:hypothetical protein